MSSNRLNTSISIKARRTELNDAEDIKRFVNKSTTDIFGPVSGVGKLHELIEKSILAITLEDDTNQKVLAQACFYDYPNVCTVKSSEWEFWFKKHFGAVRCNTLNALFLHFFASQSEYSVASIQEIIKSVFKAVPECHYVLLCVPINTVPDNTLSTVFRELKHTERTEECAMFVTKRERHIPVLFIRNAIVNDNDDLIPLFNSYTDVLKATYGDFYVAEMIEAQDANNQCLAAEADGFAMGFMSLSNDVNTELLNECYELRPFHGLCKPNHEDELKPPSRVSIKEPPRPEDQNRNFSIGDYHNAEDPEAETKLVDMAAEAIDADENEPEHDYEEGEEEEEEDDASTPESSRARTPIKHPSLVPAFIPKYYGESNAFAIQLFCIDEKFESRSLDFLSHAFDRFPDKDYCIITIPQTVPEFPLLHNFFRVTPRKTSILNQELYIFHRAGLIKEFTIRLAEDKDYEPVAKLVQNLKSKSHLLNDLEIYLKSRKFDHGVDCHAYVAEVFGQIVGIAILSDEEDIEYLRAHYNIEHFIYYSHHRKDEHGHLSRFAINPIFSYLTKYFLKEILRKSNKTCLYYPIYPEYTDQTVFDKYSLVTAINYMVPIKHRAQIEYNMKKLGINAPGSQVLESRINYPYPFALNHINRKLLLEPKITINVKIVVIGGSDTAVSFLESLVFSPHLRFTNLTLVTPKGLPASLPYDLTRDRMIPNHMNYQYDDYATMSLRSWVNIVHGKLTKIDRRRKQIVVNMQKVLPFDHLIMCAGEQYYPIAPYDLKVVNYHTKEEVEPSATRILFDTRPGNMFVLNDEYDAENLLYYIEKHNLSHKSKKIVFYGLNLNIYCTIEGLLTLGVDPTRLVVINPDLESYKINSHSCFNNPYVDLTMNEFFHSANIKIHKGFYMKNWNLGNWRSGDVLHKVTFCNFTNPKDLLEFDCDLLICNYKKNIDYNAFFAANRASLVYDGKLVVDSTFHTNDSCIRAAGTMTKFKRSYFVDSWSHGCFNSKEIGEDLADKMLQLLDPTAPPQENQHDADNQPLIPLYKQPKKLFAVLPGGYNYLHICKPGLTVPYEEERAQETFGEEFITNTHNGYFRIHINKNNIVETITCLTKNTIPATNYAKLYGLHERFLNNLKLRFKDNLIKDFYEYFNDSWCVALFHDRFSVLCGELREILVNKNNGLQSVDDLLREQVDDDLILNKDQRLKINEYYKSSGTRRLVELKLLKFLNYNYSQLPMYAKPDMV